MSFQARSAPACSSSDGSTAAAETSVAVAISMVSEASFVKDDNSMARLGIGSSSGPIVTLVMEYSGGFNA